jgi:hypothetical protein
MQAFELDWIDDLVGKIYPPLPSNNQRAYADFIEEQACKMAQELAPDLYAPASSVRSPEDFMLGDTIVDIKTRCLGREFSMPNLISVDRAKKILKDPNKDIWYWFIDYTVYQDGTFGILHSHVFPIWQLNWDSLSIQNLGLGQIQISDHEGLYDSEGDRDEWLRQLILRTRAFYVDLQRKLALRNSCYMN